MYLFLFVVWFAFVSVDLGECVRDGISHSRRVGFFCLGLYCRVLFDVVWWCLCGCFFFVPFIYWFFERKSNVNIEVVACARR